MDFADSAALRAYGILDVTAAPFAADASGKQDATATIQRAVDFGRDNRLAVYFPPGIYRVSDTIRCRQGDRIPASAQKRLEEMGMAGSNRFSPCVLVGSSQGAARPVILLAPNSPGFADPAKRKYVVRFWRYQYNTKRRKGRDPAPNTSFNQVFINLDIRIGVGNSGAVGIRHRAAQGSTVTNCTIDARHGYSGLEGGAGSGGSHHNVTVIGGQIGVDYSQTQPTPTISNFTLIGQTGPAIVHRGWQALNAVGCRIETDGVGPVIVNQSSGRGNIYGQLNLIDSEVVFNRPDPANTMVQAGQSVYLNNVYAKNATTLVKRGKEIVQPGRPEGWCQVREFALGIDMKGILADGPPADRKKDYAYDYTCPIYLDGKQLVTRMLADVALEANAPPADLLGRHAFPANRVLWDAPGAVSVTDPPYNAKGNDAEDDYAAIQKCIDEHDLVVIPRGTFRVSRTLHLRPTTRLIGLSAAWSRIAPLAAAPFFAEQGTFRPLVQTPNDAAAAPVVARLWLSGSTVVYTLRWQSGRESVYYNNSCRPVRAPFNHALNVIDGHGGGRWYNYYEEHGGHEGSPKYRHVLVRDTRSPLTFYQCNPEHVNHGEANMELAGAQNVSIFGLKAEGERIAVLVRDCDRIRIFGHGGNARSIDCEAMYVIENTPNILLSQLVTRTRIHLGREGRLNGDPRYWSMLVDRPPEGPVTKTQPLERPVLYKRGWK
jgi:hypothetical protein